MKRGIQFTMLITIVTIVAVILVALIMLRNVGLLGIGTVSRTTAIKMCEAACLNDSRLDSVSIEGVCVTSQESEFAKLKFRIGGETVTCFDLTSCVIKDSFGETCEITNLTVDMKKACEIACVLDGGIPSCIGDTCEVGTRKMERLCKLNYIGPDYHSTILNKQKCLNIGACCKLPKEGCLASWVNC